MICGLLHVLSDECCFKVSDVAYGPLLSCKINCVLMFVILVYSCLQIYFSSPEQKVQVSF